MQERGECTVSSTAKDSTIIEHNDGMGVLAIEAEAFERMDVGELVSSGKDNQIRQFDLALASIRYEVTVQSFRSKPNENELELLEQHKLVELSLPINTSMGTILKRFGKTLRAAEVYDKTRKITFLAWDVVHLKERWVRVIVRAESQQSS